jgi:hypothetical protein
VSEVRLVEDVNLVPFGNLVSGADGTRFVSYALLSSPA